LRVESLEQRQLLSGDSSQAKGDIFAAPVTYPVGGANPQGLVARDFNADGYLDLAVVNADSSNVGVFFGHENGTFPNPVSNFGASIGPQAIASADLDEDQDLDLVVGYWGMDDTGGVGVLLNNGNGAFSTATTFSTGGSITRSVAVADVNGDTYPDIVAANWSGQSVRGTVAVLLGDGTGLFGDASLYDSGGVAPTCPATAC
jgi:hypothetical protein